MSWRILNIQKSENSSANTFILHFLIYKEVPQCLSYNLKNCVPYTSENQLWPETIFCETATFWLSRSAV